MPIGSDDFVLLVLFLHSDPSGFIPAGLYCIFIFPYFGL